MDKFGRASRISDSSLSYEPKFQRFHFSLLKLKEDFQVLESKLTILQKSIENLKSELKKYEYVIIPQK